MLDYYGSILFEEDDIKKDIMNYYKQLNQGRIQECFQELKEDGSYIKTVFHIWMECIPSERAIQKIYDLYQIKEKQELDCSYLRLWFTQVSIRGFAL